MRKIIVGFIFVVLSIIISGCESMNSTEYENWRDSEIAEDLNGDRKINEADYEIYVSRSYYDSWRNSEEAEDLNSDRKINEVDYQLFLAKIYFDSWKNSEEAEDLNGDRKIDEADYDLFLNPIDNEFLSWLETEKAKDFNSDFIINEADYEIYITYSELKGNYKIVNYIYEGSEALYVGDDLFLYEFDKYLDQIILTVNDDGKITVSLSTYLNTEFESILGFIAEGLENITIEKISPYITVIDTNINVQGVNIVLSLYLNTILGGFSTSYNVTFHDLGGTIQFDILRID